MCDYSHAYIVVYRTIDILAVAANKNDKAEKDFAFKNNASFKYARIKITQCYQLFNDIK